MVVTNNISFPSDEELTVPEINLSGPALRAGSFHFGKYCENQNNVSYIIKLTYLKYQI